MRKTELTLCILALLAVILKLLHIQGGSALVVVVFSTLAVLYFCLGVALFNNMSPIQIFSKNGIKGISVLRIIGTIGAGIFLSQTLIGILFQLLHWPGGNNMLLVGLPGLGIIAMVGLVRYLQSKSVFYPLFLARIVLFGGFALILLLQ